MDKLGSISRRLQRGYAPLGSGGEQGSGGQLCERCLQRGHWPDECQDEDTTCARRPPCAQGVREPQTVQMLNSPGSVPHIDPQESGRSRVLVSSSGSETLEETTSSVSTSQYSTTGSSSSSDGSSTEATTISGSSLLSDESDTASPGTPELSALSGASDASSSGSDFKSSALSAAGTSSTCGLSRSTSGMSFTDGSTPVTSSSE